MKTRTTLIICKGWHAHVSLPVLAPARSPAWQACLPQPRNPPWVQPLGPEGCPTSHAIGCLLSAQYFKICWWLHRRPCELQFHGAALLICDIHVSLSLVPNVRLARCLQDTQLIIADSPSKIYVLFRGYAFASVEFAGTRPAWNTDSDAASYADLIRRAIG
jgi:hypothetical protein